MGWAALTAVWLAATPAFVTRGDVTPEAALRTEADALWRSLEVLYTAQAGALPTGAPERVVLKRGDTLPPSRNGQGWPGVVELRQGTPGVLDERLRTALHHELAHQFLWWACPASARDRLFHEAFALAVSGELAEWREAPYQSLTSAVGELERAPEVDTPRARRALARVLSEGTGFPRALTRRLRQCQAGTRWTVPLSAGELAGPGMQAVAPATLVLSRHSGEVVFSEGAVRTAMPYGSTLKPFVVAGSGGAGSGGAGSAAPLLAPRAEAAEWRCGERMPARMDVRTALVRSCNGYFLDWAERGSAPFGPWGAVLGAVGLTGEPVDMADAIGLRAGLGLSPWGVAQAYRLLAEARPDLLGWLADTAARGTLAELPASSAFAGVATKTGTVRDAESRPVLGWIVAVDADLVAVVARPGKMPRAFADEVPALLARVRSQRGGLEAARVQVLGLLPAEVVEARCPGAGFGVEDGTPRAMGAEFTKLGPWVEKGGAVCLGSPWRVRFPEQPAGRDYAGVFSWVPPPPYVPPAGVSVSSSALKARRGSAYVFRTTRLQYTAGVVTAEDSALKGEARVALARVVAHNERHADSRHPGRPVCDTTHCQAFQGTVRIAPEDERALKLPALRWREWLPFSKGGQEPWTQTRPRSQVESVLGQGVTGLRFAEGRVHYLRTTREQGAVYDESESVPCEVLRSPLKLPACPRSAVLEGASVMFQGQGQGHGEGLDVEAAKASTANQEQLLDAAYGPSP